jgi:hypothetical protein
MFKSFAFCTHTNRTRALASSVVHSFSSVTILTTNAEPVQHFLHQWRYLAGHVPTFDKTTACYNRLFLLRKKLARLSDTSRVATHVQSHVKVQQNFKISTGIYILRDNHQTSGWWGLWFSKIWYNSEKKKVQKNILCLFNNDLIFVCTKNSKKQI